MLSLCCFLLCPAFLYAGDTLSVMQRNLRNNSFGETFFDLLYRNPAEKILSACLNSYRGKCNRGIFG